MDKENDEMCFYVGKVDEVTSTSVGTDSFNHLTYSKSFTYCLHRVSDKEYQVIEKTECHIAHGGTKSERILAIFVNNIDALDFLNKKIKEKAKVI